MKSSHLVLSLLILPCMFSCKQNIFVAPDGNDNFPGTKGKPVKTVEKAFDMAEGRGGGCCIYMREGKYGITKGLTLEGVKDITISAFRNEKATVTGAIPLSVSDFVPVNDSSILSRIKPEVRGKVMMLDFRDKPELFHGITAKGFGRQPASSWTEVLVDGEPLTLARWPKDREIPITKVFRPGVRRKVNGVVDTTVAHPEIRIDNDEVYSFGGNEGLWLWGYFSASFAEDMVPVERIDKEEQKMTLGLTSIYGFSRCTEGNAHKRWAMLNVLEEMSRPGEYVSDPELKRLYLIAPAGGLEKADLTVLDTAMVTLTKCSGIRFSKLVFEGGRSDGFIMEGCSDCVIDHCVLRNIGRLAVHIGPGIESVRNGLSHCDIYNIGSGGVELFGGDRLSLTPGDCFVEDCRIHNFNRMNKSYRPAVKFGECGNRISHSELYDAPSMAVLFNGNNQTIEYCDIHDVCKEIADQAAIYYGRNPTERGSKIRYTYIHDIHSGWNKWVFGIYHDDGACGVDVFGCVFNKIEISAGNIGGGSDISYRNCIFMNSPAALSIDDRNAINGIEGKYCFSYKPKFAKVKYQEAPFVNEYPELKNYYEEKPQNPKRIIVKDNLYYKVDRIWEAYVLHSRDYLDNFEKYGFDISENPGLIDPEDPMKGLDMKKVREIHPDFEPIPFEKIGCRQ